MHRVGTTTSGNALIEVSEQALATLFQSATACAQAAAEMVVSAPNPTVPVAPAEAPPLRAAPASPVCVVCGRSICSERVSVRSNTCSERCRKQQRFATHRAQRQRRLAAKETGHAAPAAATCMICGKSLKGRSRTAKTCSRRCAQEKNRRYQRDLYAARMRRQGAVKAARPVRPPVAAAKTAPPAPTDAATNPARPALTADKARRLAMIRALAQRNRPAAGDPDDSDGDQDPRPPRGERLDDEAMREVRKTAARMKADDGL